GVIQATTRLTITGNDVDLGSTAGFGFELRHDC
ncbi:MAG: hypothetical protein ACD_10C00545G0001, partial [uncultured bacterium]